MRSEGLRSECLRSEGLRSEGLRSESLRSEGLRSECLRSEGLRSGTDIAEVLKSVRSKHGFFFLEIRTSKYQRDVTRGTIFQPEILKLLYSSSFHFP